MRSVLALAAAALALPTAAADAAQRGTSPEGARFTLDGRVATVVLPKPLAPGKVLRVRCGRESLVRQAVGAGRARGRGLRTVRVRLRGKLEDAEWCEYDGPRRRDGAAALAPGAPAFERVTRGPGVREAPGDDHRGGGTFLLRGSLLTVELNRPFARSQLAWLGCGAGENPIAGRRIAVRAGQRVLSADLEADTAAARWCIVEAPGGTDLTVAELP